MFPSKGRYISYGYRYNMDIKYTASYSSEEVLVLENDRNPACKHENGFYKYENCLRICQKTYINKICGCNPTFFFVYDRKYSL